MRASKFLWIILRCRNSSGPLKMGTQLCSGWPGQQCILVFTLSSSASFSFSSTLVSLGATIPNEMVAHTFCFGGESRLRQLSSHFNITYRQWHFTETDFIYKFISIWCKWSLSFRVYHGTFLSSCPWILQIHTLRVSVTLFLSVVLVIVFIWVEQHLMCQNSCTWT